MACGGGPDVSGHRADVLERPPRVRRVITPLAVPIDQAVLAVEAEVFVVGQRQVLPVV